MLTRRHAILMGVAACAAPKVRAQAGLRHPFLQHRTGLSLLGVPVWQGAPLYPSCLIGTADDPATGLVDLRGGAHAFSDRNSNSGFLVIASDLARMGEARERFFSLELFTNGHRNVVRAVAGELTRSGSVDGIIWNVLNSVEPDLRRLPRSRAHPATRRCPPVGALVQAMDASGGSPAGLRLVLIAGLHGSAA